MTTLKMRAKRLPTSMKHAHVPEFMQPKMGNAISISVAQGNGEFQERWMVASAFNDAVEATPLETSIYMESKDHEFLLQMNEPDPIETHDSEIWADLTDDEEFRRAA